MLRASVLILLLVLTAPPLAAQASADRPWQFRMAAGWQRFRGAARDTSTGVSIDIRPGNTMGFEIGIAHRWGSWEARLDLGYASGKFLGESDQVAILDKNTQSTRGRGSVTLAYRLATIDGNRLQLEAGPTLDYWDTEAVSSRASLGLRTGLSLLISLGGLVLENNLSFGVSASPFQRRDMPPGSRARALTTFSVGGGLRVPL